jgi:hypothetical protein
MTIGSLSWTLPVSREPGPLARYAAAFPTAELNSSFYGHRRSAAGGANARWLPPVGQGTAGPDPGGDCTRRTRAPHPGRAIPANPARQPQPSGLFLAPIMCRRLPASSSFVLARALTGTTTAGAS